MAYKNLLTISNQGVGKVGVFESEEAFRTGVAPLETYEITATGERDGWYEELSAKLEEQ